MLTILTAGLLLNAGIAGPGCSSGAPGDNRTAVTNAAWNAEKDIVDTAVAAGSFKTLAAALGAAGLVDTLKSAGPFTVFAPTDEAFAKLPTGTVESLLKPENKDKLTAILLYHVVPGSLDAAHVLGTSELTTVNGQRAAISMRAGSAMIDTAKIVKTDIHAKNGVIHVIDTVMLPESRTIPQVAEAAGSFGTLLAAVKAAGLSETLSGKGPFTVFAPTDEAFAALGSTVGDLLKPENRAKLTKILTTHVVSGRVYADQARGLHEATAVSGSVLKISESGEKLMISGATVVSADIEAGNGVIHVIDKVILP